MSDDIKEILNHLIKTPKECEVVIDFNLEKRIFYLSIPIYRSCRHLPHSVKEYVEARKGRVFKPHCTTFEIEEGLSVKLVQEIPFRWGLDGNGRQELLDFLSLAKRCHRILYEIALEEKYQTALSYCLAN